MRIVKEELLKMNLSRSLGEFNRRQIYDKFRFTYLFIYLLFFLSKQVWHFMEILSPEETLCIKNVKFYVLGKIGKQFQNIVLLNF